MSAQRHYRPALKLVLCMSAATTLATGCIDPLTTITSPSDAPRLEAVAAIEAAANCDVTRHGPNEFSAGLRGFECSVVMQEAGSHGCWAACIEMLNRYASAQSVDPAFSTSAMSASAEAADALGVLATMSPELSPRYQAGRASDAIDVLSGGAWGSIASAFDLARVHSDWLIEEVLSGHPVVVGLREEHSDLGHVCVIFGVRFSVAEPTRIPLKILMESPSENVFGREVQRATQREYSRFVLHEVCVMDPDPVSGGVKRLTSYELKQSKEFLVSRRLADAWLGEAILWRQEVEKKMRSQVRYGSSPQTLRLGVGRRN